MMTRTSIAVKRHLGEFARPIFGDYFFGDYYRALQSTSMGAGAPDDSRYLA
jgi:hypothetical protein